ncbi:MAG: hypothetical protein AAGF11_18955 [Myxococcota bacterium]
MSPSGSGSWCGSGGWGGARATACLARVIEKGRFDADAVASAEYEHEIRWEAARFGVAGRWLR